MRLGLPGRLAGSFVGSGSRHPAHGHGLLRRFPALLAFYCIAQTRAILDELPANDHSGQFGCRFRDSASMGGKWPVVKAR
jgi:hypothetical protein